MNMLEKLFGFNHHTHTVRTEIIAGITTFLTMAYILAVNPQILGDASMDKGAVFTATAIMSGLATIFMGLYAKLPFALAPGMGLNAFFAYTVCIVMGHSWQFALTAVFIEGIIFILLTISNLRNIIVDLIPPTLRHAIGAGIGLFIALIGLQNAGIIVKNDATIIGLGDIGSNPVLLAFIGIILTSILLVRNIKGALLIGILVTTLIGIPMGVTHIDNVFSLPPSIEPVFFKLEWSQIFTKDMFSVVFTMLFLDIFDTLGTVIGVTTRSGMVNKDGSIPHLKQIFMVDSIATTTGALMGTNTVTLYVESATGVNEGGRTGLTAFTTGICFLAALLFAPLFLSIPTAATSTALIIVGVMMMSPVLKIDFNDYSEAIPAFICITFMPFAYSISDGIVFGMLSYILINLCSGKHQKISVGMYILAAFFLIKFFI